MDTEKTLQCILDIKPNNKFLEYIVERVKREDYRGLHISQHNRYEMDDVIVMLKAIYEVVQNGFLQIPLGDASNAGIQNRKRGRYQQYASLVDRIRKERKKTTMNSLKKNFFVDFSRAGFIDRFGKDKNILDPDKRSHVYFVKLTTDAIKLIKTQKIMQRYSLFSTGVDKLFGNTISDLAGTIYNSKYSADSISYTEFQYILTDKRRSGNEKMALLSSYRDLADREKRALHGLLKKYCTPGNFVGSKKAKRDYHNWRNATQQIMRLLKNTIYFDVRKDNFALNRGRFGIFPEKTKPMRRLGVKQEYFFKHGVAKRENFELHHIVPIKFVRNRTEFTMIDNYRNLIYIARSTHKAIKDYHLLLHIENKVVRFRDISPSKLRDVKAANNSSVVYKEKLAPEMLKHNKKVLKERFDYAC